jgi:negative regulator of sigma E activity
MNMDHELHDALRRKQAPHDLADRVLARINQGEAPSKQGAAPSKQGAGATSWRSGSTGSNVRRWLAAAAVLAVTVGGAERYYQQQQAAEAVRVQDELRIALQITSDTLARVQSKLSQPADNGGR